MTNQAPELDVAALLDECREFYKADPTVLAAAIEEARKAMEQSPLSTKQLLAAAGAAIRDFIRSEAITMWEQSWNKWGEIDEEPDKNK